MGPIRVRCALEDGHDDQDNEILGRTIIYTPETRADKGTVISGDHYTANHTRSNVSTGEYINNITLRKPDEMDHAHHEKELDFSSSLGVVGEMIADHEKGTWRPFGILSALRKTGGTMAEEAEMAS